MIMALFNGLFKSSPFQVYHLNNQLTKAGERFFADHPEAKKIADCTQMAVDAYMRAMGGLKSNTYENPVSFKPNEAYSHNFKLQEQEVGILCRKIIDAGAKMVVTDFSANVNLLVFTDEMVLFWTASLFLDGVYIHPAPYKDKFLSHIHMRGVDYYYYYQSPRGTSGDRVWFGEAFDKPTAQLHTAEGYCFSGDRKEDHKLDVAFARFLNVLWRE